MDNLIYFRHWGPSGDLLTCLPGIEQVCKTRGKKAVILQRLNVRPFLYEGAIHSIKNESGEPVCMSRKQWEMLTPLLEAQKYIDHCEVFDGQKYDYNLDKIREGTYTPLPHGDLYHLQSLIYPEMATNLSHYDLKINVANPVKDLVKNKVLINLTPRYRNQHITYFFLRDYDNLMFIGTEDEHMTFCSDYSFLIPRLAVDNFFELACAISLAKFFLGNQSMCYHIAEGVHAKRMYEVSLPVANVWPHTPGPGIPYTTQENCEKIFKEFYATTSK